MKYHSAPWSPLLIATSAVMILLCLGAAGLFAIGLHSPRRALWPLIALMVAPFFTVRRYSFSGEFLLVHRLGWVTRVPLSELQSVQYQPDLMSPFLWIWNSGLLTNRGFFAFAGRYLNTPVGEFTAWVTDPHRTVVLRYPRHLVVVSPDSPENFVRDLIAERHLPVGAADPRTCR